MKPPNFKDGSWAGDKERATRNEYNRLWRLRNPGYHKKKSKAWDKLNRCR